MRAPVASIDLTVKIISGFVLVLTAGFWVVSCFIHWAFLPAGFLTAITLYCYLRAPVAYEASPAALTIVFRLGSKHFGPVVRAGRVEKSTDRSIRLWGNGGLFAGTGIFWNGTWGIFRAYVTKSDRESIVLVETRTGKVLVSPKDPSAFIEALNG
jgi:hypothetical protein